MAGPRTLQVIRQEAGDEGERIVLLAEIPLTGNDVVELVEATEETPEQLVVRDPIQHPKTKAEKTKAEKVSA